MPLFHWLKAEHLEVRHHVGHVGNLEGGVGAARDEAEASLVVDDGGRLAKEVPLIGVVVDRRVGGDGIFDAEPIVQELSGHEIVHVAAAATVGPRQRAFLSGVLSPSV
jgi:hypothetical protein